jgi:hypothetical protein
MRFLISLLVIAGLGNVSCATPSQDKVPAPIVETRKAIESVSEAPAVPVVATPAPQDPADTLEAAPPAPVRKLRLECVSGSKVMGLVDRWSPLSTCPAGYEVTGLSRIDLQGDHNRPNLHVNDFICDARGCKAWCIGDGCTVEARCCRISE